MLTSAFLGQLAVTNW